MTQDATQDPTQEPPFAGWRDELGVFALAVQFLTRLPVPRDLAFSEGRLLRATRYYPAVGLLVGAIGAGVLLGAALALPWPVAVLLSVAATVAATGAFHEDGLADAADGLGGGLTRARALEIMRDSHVGTMGALALIFVIGTKASLLATVAGHGPGTVLDVVFLMPVAGRCATLLCMTLIPYVREEGLASLFWERTWPRFALAMLVLFAAGWAAGGWVGIAAVLVCLVVVGAFTLLCHMRLGGGTGDTLGALTELAELAVGLGFVAALQVVGLAAGNGGGA